MSVAETDLTIIHNVYNSSKYIRESLIANIKALEESTISYQYLIFNDCGSKEIEASVVDLLSDRVEYIYSNINYGMGVQTGGWIGALKHAKGHYIHNTGQDDVFTALFYKSLVGRLQNSNIYLAYANGFKVNAELAQPSETMGPLENVDYTDPRRVFDMWFGKQGNAYTRANNYIPAPGVIYNKQLHSIIGLPDFEQFQGSADFEYWARVLFNRLGVSYDPRPLWLYRRSEQSLGANPAFENKSIEWNKLILKKYQQLAINESNYDTTISHQ